jgi:twinkle protein
MKVSVKDISVKLADRCDEVVRFLLPAGKQHGQLWEAGGTNGHSGKSLKVHLTGAHIGSWCDWADSEKGDLLDLWSAVKGIPLPDAIREAKDFLGIRDEIIPAKTYSKPEKQHPAIVANGRVMQWMVTERKLEPSIVNRYRISGCAEHQAVVFPSYSPQGELLNHSYRTLTAEKKVWQDKGCAPSLWGWHGISEAAWEKRTILICEGQIDAMTWAQWGVEALSIPNGGGRTWIDYDWHNLEAFETIYLSFDMDGKSDENLRETISRLGKHRCRIVKMPEKDANDALKAGRTADDAKAWLAASEYLPVKQLVDPTKFAAQVAERFFPSRAEALGLAIPQTVHKNPRKSFRFRNGELTLWTGTTGHGKSTFLNLAAIMLALQGQEPALIFSMETAPPEVIYRQMLGVNMKPGNQAEVRSGIDSIAKHVLFYDKVGGIEQDELFEVMSYARARFGVRDIVIDSMMRVGALEEDYPAQTKFTIRCVTFARETGCRIHLVAHPRKSAGDSSPRSQDISGSGNIRNNADNVLVLWRNVEKERKIEEGEDCDEPDAILSVEKDRIVGEFRKFPLVYLPEKYRYEPCDLSMKAESPKQKRNYHQD